MCLDCGCGKPNENHGDKRHVTMDTIETAAKASGISREEAMRNIEQGLKQAGGEGQAQEKSRVSA